jgi:hypothetical protein
VLLRDARDYKRVLWVGKWDLRARAQPQRGFANRSSSIHWGSTRQRAPKVAVRLTARAGEARRESPLCAMRAASPSGTPPVAEIAQAAFSSN